MNTPDLLFSLAYVCLLTSWPKAFKALWQTTNTDAFSILALTLNALASLAFLLGNLWLGLMGAACFAGLQLTCHLVYTGRVCYIRHR